MGWIILFFAGLLEICWAVGLKYSNGFSKLYPSIFTIVTMALSVFLLAWSLKTLPIGTAYAVWTGIGAIGTVIFGIFFFGDSASFWRIFCLTMILAGIIGLKLLTQESE